MYRNSSQVRQQSQYSEFGPNTNSNYYQTDSLALERNSEDYSSGNFSQSTTSQIGKIVPLSSNSNMSSSAGSNGWTKTMQMQ